MIILWIYISMSSILICVFLCRPKDLKLPRNVQYPGRGSVYDYYFDKATFGAWHPWEKVVVDNKIPKDAKVDAAHSTRVLQRICLRFW